MFDFEQEDWHTTDINVDDLWIINKRDSSGKHENVYHGNFVPQIPYQLIKRFTRENDIVLDVFSGSGTTLFECEKLNRNFIGFDINKKIIDYVESKMDASCAIKYVINQCDSANSVEFDYHIKKSLNYLEQDSVDLMIAHPPYLDIVQFTDLESDLSKISQLNPFLDKFKMVMDNGLRYLKQGGYFAVVAGDVYKKGEVVPLGFYIMNTIKSNFSCKLKGIIVKNIEGNRGKIGSADIWKYRALKNDYYIFKHEYIFVFKKET